MDFVSIVLFLAVYYIRPQEMSSLLSVFRPVLLVLVFSLGAMVLRNRQFSLRSLVSTPHDWFVYGFLLWGILVADSPLEAFGRVKVFLVGYMVVVHALSTWERLRRFLVWWMGLMFFIAALAVVSHYGFDPLDSKYLTEQIQKGRLSLNLSIFENPNALGHNVVPLLPMLYFFMFWRRPIFVKEVGALLASLPLLCLFLTQSKGTYLSGFVTMLVGMTFKRPRMVQISIVLLAATLGWAGLKMLPRMEEMKNPRADEGIAARLTAWNMGMEKMKANLPYGFGMDRFSFVFEDIYGYPKAAHSTYVQIGAELGYGGLMLFCGILYCCIRTLATKKTEEVEQERLQRVLMVMLTAFMVSSWMIGFATHVAFYVLAGTIAAFHRLVQAEEAGRELAMAGRPQKDLPAGGIPEWKPVLAELPAPAAVSFLPTISAPIVQPLRPGPNGDLQPELLPAADPTFAPKTGGSPKPMWTRPGLLDLFFVWLLTAAVVWFWGYILRNL